MKDRITRIQIYDLMDTQEERERVATLMSRFAMFPVGSANTKSYIPTNHIYMVDEFIIAAEERLTAARSEKVKSILTKLIDRVERWKNDDE